VDKGTPSNVDDSVIRRIVSIMFWNLPMISVDVAHEFFTYVVVTSHL
jgi:hypothetical protein